MVFEFPTKKEFKAIKELQKNVPEVLDGRELWVLENFCEGDFE